ncbi:hypothetical protein WAI453_005590 [Rhynchosporium graminicola]
MKSYPPGTFPQSNASHLTATGIRNTTATIGHTEYANLRRSPKYTVRIIHHKQVDVEEHQHNQQLSALQLRAIMLSNIGLNSVQIQESRCQDCKKENNRTRDEPNEPHDHKSGRLGDWERSREVGNSIHHLTIE